MKVSFTYDVLFVCHVYLKYSKWFFVIRIDKLNSSHIWSFELFKIWITQ